MKIEINDENRGDVSRMLVLMAKIRDLDASYVWAEREELRRHDTTMKQIAGQYEKMRAEPSARFRELVAKLVGGDVDASTVQVDDDARWITAKNGKAI